MRFSWNKKKGFLEVATITKEMGFFSENLHMRAWTLMWIYNSVWGQERECEYVSLSLFFCYLFFPLCIREETSSQVNSLKAMMTFQRKQSPYALTWILEKQTTNVMHDCTWQADMVGKFSCVVCGFWNYANLQRISRREGQTLFCCWAARWVSIEKCRVTQEKDKCWTNGSLFIFEKYINSIKFWLQELLINKFFGMWLIACLVITEACQLLKSGLAYFHDFDNTPGSETY